MIKRVVMLALGFAALFGANAFAADFRPFNRAQFEAAQAAGRPILIDVAASWCPTCRAQDPIIHAIAAEPAYRAMIVFRVDYDSQRGDSRAFGARQQSTLIAYHGRKETARALGITDRPAIEALMATATR